MDKNSSSQLSKAKSPALQNGDDWDVPDDSRSCSRVYTFPDNGIRFVILQELKLY